MATKHYTKAAWHFQYALPEDGPRAEALRRQGATESATPAEDPDNPGTSKTVFPGSTTVSLGVAASLLLTQAGDALLTQSGNNLAF